MSDKNVQIVDEYKPFSLQNLGNTCFGNTFIQCVYSLTRIREAITYPNFKKFKLKKSSYYSTRN